MSLSQRSTQAERMDTDCVDFADYARCLRDLSRVNTVTMTHRPMLAWLAARATPGFSLLDIACGHGDIIFRPKVYGQRCDGHGTHSCSISGGL